MEETLPHPCTAALVVWIGSKNVPNPALSACPSVLTRPAALLAAATVCLCVLPSPETHIAWAVAFSQVPSREVPRNQIAASREFDLTVQKECVTPEHLQHSKGQVHAFITQRDA